VTTAGSRLRKNLWFAYFCALLSWGWCAYAQIYRYFKEGTFFARIMDGRPYINDAVQLYNAALLARRCLSGNLDIYDPLVQDQGLKALVAPVVPETNQFLQYPPQFFALAMPFSLLSMTAAYFVWCGIALVLILVALWFLTADVLKSGFARAFVFVGTLTCFPAWISFELAQTSLYQFPATIVFWLLLKQKRFFCTGLLSALLLVKLQYTPAFILVGVIIGRMRYLRGFLIGASTLAVVTVWAIGWNNVLKYPQALRFAETNATVGGISPVKMQNFRGELVLLLGGDYGIVHVLSLGIFLVSILLICLLWMKLYPRLLARMGMDTAFGACAAGSALISLVASPHTHIQEYLTAVMASVFLYPLLQFEQSRVLRRLLAILLIGFPVLSWVFFLLMPAFQFIKFQPYFFWDLSTLCVTGLIVRRMLSTKVFQPERS
jgi:hypothetical protein